MLRTTSRRRGRRLATACLVAGATVILAAGPFAASASAGTNCDPGYHCVFYSTFASAKRQFFNGAARFTQFTFNEGGSYGRGQTVNDNNWSLSNSTTGGYYSVYLLHENYAPPGPPLVCVAPGASVAWYDMPGNGVRGDGIGVLDEASSLTLTRTNPGGCLG